jgi:hypothetical protein
MTKDLKFVPVAPKTYEVRYVENENKQSGLSPAARSKVINRIGGNYISSRAMVNNPSYGPGVDSPETHYCAASNCYEKIDDSLTYCSKHSQVSSSSSSNTVIKGEKVEASEEEGTTYHADGSVTKYKKKSVSVSSSTTTTK